MASTDTTSYKFDIHTANTAIYGALSGAAFDTLAESIGHGTAAAPQLVGSDYVFQTYIVPVPEPFSVSLLLCGSIFMLARRARS